MNALEETEATPPPSPHGLLLASACCAVVSLGCMFIPGFILGDLNAPDNLNRYGPTPLYIPVTAILFPILSLIAIGLALAALKRKPGPLGYLALLLGAAPLLLLAAAYATS